MKKSSYCNDRRGLMSSKAIKIFDLTKELVDILSTMTQEELEYLKLQYEVVFKYEELLKMRKELIGGKNK